MSCHLFVVCSQIRSLLEHIGVAHNEIGTDCYPPAPCPGIFANLELLAERVNPENSASISEFFRTVIGSLPVSTSAAARRGLSKTPFWCPELRIHIYQPCRVSSCTFHTGLDRHDPQEWIRNCILHYRVLQQRDSLEIRELSFLTGSTSNKIRAVINSALVRLRHEALLAKTEKAGGESVDAPEDACSVCWGAIHAEGPYRASGGFVYCSEACYDWKRPVTLGVEQRFGLPADRVLEICATSFATTRNVAQALGVTPAQLRELCQRHDIDVAHLH